MRGNRMEPRIVAAPLNCLLYPSYQLEKYMAKSQQRSTKEAKKPKKVKVPDSPLAPVAIGPGLVPARVGGDKKKR